MNNKAGVTPRHLLLPETRFGEKVLAAAQMLVLRKELWRHASLLVGPLTQPLFSLDSKKIELPVDGTLIMVKKIQTVSAVIGKTHPK